jgi:hypothetical protein
MLQGFAHCGKFGEMRECNQITFEYDAKIMILLLMVCFE